jgi:hypothetical protein
LAFIKASASRVNLSSREPLPILLFKSVSGVTSSLSETEGVNSPSVTVNNDLHPIEKRKERKTIKIYFFVIKTNFLKSYLQDHF